MKAYPLKFEPIYKEKIWGNREIINYFNRNLPNNLSQKNIGESWELAAHPHGSNKIINGKYRERELREIIDKYPEKILGNITKKRQRTFPLLLKFLDVDQKLSVQVHPNNKYAYRVEGEPGKTELWYILKAKPGAELIYGVKPGINRSTFKNALQNNNLEKCLNKIRVRAGDIFYIPSGTIHSLKGGILLAEIQQNSDTTYRVYDWNRPGENGQPRPLHIDKALQVIDFQKKSLRKSWQPLTLNKEDYSRSFLAATPYFISEIIDIKNNYTLTTDNKFKIMTVLAGSPQLNYKNSKLNLNPGETLLIPAALEKISIASKGRLFINYVPDCLKTVKNKLIKLGFAPQEIKNLAGIQD